MFRAHLAIARHEIPKRGVVVVVQPDDRKTGIDPEQRLLAPMFVSEDRIRFEFQRGEVVFVSPKGEVEIRLVAVDTQRGEVGTRTIARFHTRWAALVARCEAEITGAGQLFPPTLPRWAKRLSIPKGEANLSFGTADAPAHEMLTIATQTAASPSMDRETAAREAFPFGEGARSDEPPDRGESLSD